MIAFIALHQRNQSLVYYLIIGIGCKWLFSTEQIVLGYMCVSIGFVFFCMSLSLSMLSIVSFFL